MKNFTKLKFAVAVISVIVSSLLISCSEELDEESAATKVEETLSSVNKSISSAKGIVYLLSGPDGRANKGEGYYLQFDNGNLEKLQIQNRKGKAVDIDFSISKVGKLLFVKPTDWEQFCKALGHGSGKTEEEANILERLYFNSYIMDRKTGKLSVWPNDVIPCESAYPGAYGDVVDENGDIYCLRADSQNGEKIFYKIDGSSYNVTTIYLPDELKHLGDIECTMEYMSDGRWVFHSLNHQFGEHVYTIVLHPDGELQYLPESTLVDGELYTIGPRKSIEGTYDIEISVLSRWKLKGARLVEEELAELDEIYLNLFPLVTNPLRKTLIFGGYEFDGQSVRPLEGLCSYLLFDARIIEGMDAWFVLEEHCIRRVNMSDYSSKEIFSIDNRESYVYDLLDGNLKGLVLLARRISDGKSFYYHITHDGEYSVDTTFDESFSAPLYISLD